MCCMVISWQSKPQIGKILHPSEYRVRKLMLVMWYPSENRAREKLKRTIHRPFRVRTNAIFMIASHIARFLWKILHSVADSLFVHHVGNTSAERKQDCGQEEQHAVLKDENKRVMVSWMTQECMTTASRFVNLWQLMVTRCSFWMHYYDAANWKMSWWKGTR
jgi:hypothetical protein